MVRVVLILLFILPSLLTHAQTIHETEYQSEVDLILFISDYRPNADAVIYWVEDKFKAKRNDCDGLWYRGEWRSSADLKVYFTEYEFRADYQVFIADSEMIAKIINRSLCGKIKAVRQ